MTAAGLVGGVGSAPALAPIIAKSISRFSFERFPDAVVAAATRAFVDTVGVALAGFQEPCVEILVRDRMLARTCATVSLWGRGGGALTDHAALVNAAAAHALDYDDTGAASQGHPSAVLVPGLIALAERHQLPGRRLIEGYVAGVEVLNRVSQLCPLLHFRGVHPTSALGVIAMAAAGSRLLDLSPIQTSHALGLAASMSSGVFENLGSMAKPLHAGIAAANGVSSVLAAYNGFTAGEAALGGLLGLLGGQFSGADLLFQNVGSHFAILDPGLNVKRYPSCALSHRLLDALLELRLVHGLRPHQVEIIRCRATPRAVKILRFDDPVDPFQSRFSVPFLIAAGVVDGTVGLDTFCEARLRDPELRSLMARVDFRLHEDWQDGRDEWRPDRVEVTTVAGEVLSSECVYPLGHARRPLETDLLRAKFLDCATIAVSGRQAKALFDALQHLPQAVETSLLTNLTVPEGCFGIPPDDPPIELMGIALGASSQPLQPSARPCPH